MTLNFHPKTERRTKTYLKGFDKDFCFCTKHLQVPMLIIKISQKHQNKDIKLFPQREANRDLYLALFSTAQEET